MNINLRLTATIVAMSASTLSAQAKTIKALFIGNSYTDNNNLPQIILDIAQTTGDTLIYSTNTPGGYTFRQHSFNQNTLNLIEQGGWDYVVLQEQSQHPAFTDIEVQNDVFPYARILDSLVKVNNPCAETVFYMTWGRKNGDQQNCRYFPPICTYLGMDSMLQLRYTQMAEANKALISPVAKTWRYIRNQYPNIELYAGDESHPTEAGSIAAAATFYTVLFQKDPTLATYRNNMAGIADIYSAAKAIAYDSLNSWYQHSEMPLAQFSTTINNLDATFNNESLNGVTYEWNFGDGSTSTLANPIHTYNTEGDYMVKLISKSNNCDHISETQKEIKIIAPVSIVPIHNFNINIHPNPAHDILNIKTDIKQDYEIKIVDYLGKMVLRQTANSSNQAISINTLAKGFYLVQVYQNNKIIHQQKINKL